MIISILVDNPESWIMPYARRLALDMKDGGHEVHFVHKQDDVPAGDIAFFLSCEKLVNKEVRDRNKHNLVIHESALPKGKGWSPLTWQILEGKNNIPITLFEAEEDVDSGVIYLQDSIKFEGHELNQELKSAQGEKTIELAKKFVNVYPNVSGKGQAGEETFYKKRDLKDSELDVNKTIAEQFELLRVVDNKRYPAFFKYRGKMYIIRIEKENE